MNLVTLTNPIVIIGYIIALVLTVIGIVKKGGLAITLGATSVFVVTAAYALIAGSSLYETATVAVIYFIVNLGGKIFRGKR